MAVLDIDEVSPAGTGDFGGAHVASNELLHVVVGEDLVVRRHIKFLVQQGVSESHTGFPFLFVVRAAEATRVRELKTDDKVVGGSPLGQVLSLENVDEFRDAALVLFVEDELIGVGAPIGADGHGFGAADELGAARTEALPAPFHLGRRTASRGAVPAFHRMDGDAVADALTVDQHAFDGVGEGVAVAGFNAVFHRQVDAERGAVGTEIRNRLERRDTGEFKGSHRKGVV